MAQYQNKHARLGWSAGEIIFDFMTIPLTGCTAISYSTKQEKVNLYGTGNYPIGYGVGKVENEGSITLYRDEVLQIMNSIPSGKLVDAALFNLIMNFTPEGSTEENIVVLRNCQFLEDKFASKQGDTMIEQELPLLVGSVSLNGRDLI